MTDEERRRLFDIDKLNRKTLLYKNNILSVQKKISELENEMLNQTDNSLIRNKNSKEILDLNQKILYYRLQIQIFQNQLSEIEQAK
jgi:predicted transcriptional regulator with HTH domain